MKTIWDGENLEIKIESISETNKIEENIMLISQIQTTKGIYIGCNLEFFKGDNSFDYKDGIITLRNYTTIYNLAPSKNIIIMYDKNVYDFLINPQKYDIKLWTADLGGKIKIHPFL